MRRRFDGCVSVYKSGARDEPVDPSVHHAATYPSANNSTADNPTADYASPNDYATTGQP